jgi:hypothetical protein
VETKRMNRARIVVLAIAIGAGVPLPTVADGQSNMAAMIDSPSDLVQPRPETPVYTMRPTEGFEEYRKGNATATQYPDAERAKLSDTGK